jgi:hypothetical protein
LVGVTAFLCGAFVLWGAYTASAHEHEEECPVRPTLHDMPGTEIVGTECYEGHDEPILSFYSTIPGSASNMTWQMILPTERTATAATYTSNTPNPAQTYQNYAHFQIFLVLCDPNGTGNQGVQVACTPNSDANAANVGSSLLELKFIPPGEPLTQPFGGFNCSNRTTTQWCAIAQIQINNTCPGSPAFNEAWITTNGRPPQPVFGFPQAPAPANVLLMNQGDRIRVTLTDTPNGLLIVVVDETTHTTGYLLTNAANGFGSVDPTGGACTQHAFTYRPLWNTAKCAEAACGGVAHGYTPFSNFINVGWSLEIGHSETTGGDAGGCATTVNVPAGTYCFGEDTDLDGSSYQAANWPPGANAPPTAAQIISPIGTGVGPTTSNQLYSHIRFTAGSGRGAFNAQNAGFYPYYSLLQPPASPPGQGCSLVIGNFVQGANNSVNDFGQLGQYGTPAGRGPIGNRPC